MAAMPDAKANAARPPSSAATLASSAARVGLLRARVLVALVAAEPLLHVRRRLVDGRDDGAGRRVGLLAGVDALRAEAGVSGSFMRTDSERAGPTPARPSGSGAQAPLALIAARVLAALRGDTKS